MYVRKLVILFLNILPHFKDQITMNERAYQGMTQTNLGGYYILVPDTQEQKNQGKVFEIEEEIDFFAEVNDKNKNNTTHNTQAEKVTTKEPNTAPMEIMQ